VALVVMATGDLGHFPSSREYAEWGALNQRTAFRQWEGIREVFGDEWRTVIERLAAEVDRRASGRRPGVITKLPVPA
jgi:hypothetical protein